MTKKTADGIKQFREMHMANPADDLEKQQEKEEKLADNVLGFQTKAALVKAVRQAVEVFREMGQKMLDDKAFRDPKKTLADVTVFPKIHAHAFRKAWGQRMYMLGKSVGDIQELWGHKARSLTENYL